MEASVALYKALAAGQIHAVIHDAEEQTGEVNVGHAGTAVAPFSGNGGLHAANGAVVIGIFLFDAPLDKGRDDNFVVVQGWHAEAQLHDLNALVEKFRIQVCVIADRQVRLGQTGLGHRLEHQEA